MPITTESFDSAFWPDEVVAAIAVSVLVGAPFDRNLTPVPISKGSVSFPRSSPTGFDWVAECQPLPAVDLGDDAHVVATAKLAGSFNLSNETLDHADADLGALLEALEALTPAERLDHAFS